MKKGADEAPFFIALEKIFCVVTGTV